MTQHGTRDRVSKNNQPMRRYLNLVIQFFGLAIALVPNLFYPAILGLHYHGEFIRLSALPYFAAYVISLPFDNLLLKEMAREKRLSLMEGVRRLLWIKLLLANVLYFAASPFIPPQNIPVELILLNSAGISSFALTCVFADNRKPRMAVLLSVIGLAAVLLGVSARVFALSPATLVIGNACLNVAVFALSCLALPERLTGGPKLHLALKRIVGFFAISSALVTLSYGIVAFAAPFMAPSRLSILRIAVSVAQATTTFFPVSQKTIMEQVSRLSVLDRDGSAVTRYLRASLMIVGFIGFGTSAAEMLVLFLMRARIAPLAQVSAHWDVVVVMTPALSLFLLASVIEKAIIGAVSERRAVAFGLTATATMVVVSFVALTFLVNGGFVAYTLSALTVATVAALFIRGPLRRVWIVAASIVIGVLLSIALAWTAYQAGPNSLLASFCVLALLTAAFGLYLLRKERTALSEFLRS